VNKTVLIATTKPFSAGARAQIEALLEEAGFSVKLLESYQEPSQLKEAIADAAAVIIRSDIIDAEILDAAKELRLVVRAGAGYDNVDLEAARKRDVVVMNTPGQNANAVAELVFGMMIYMARGRFGGKPGTELRGKTLGIHALGNVGKAVLEVAKGFGMSVVAFDPFVDHDWVEAAGAIPVDTVEELYSRSNYVSLHVPATAKTKGSIGKALLERMPKGGTLINTARKEVIDEAGLLEALSARPDLRYITDIAPSPATQATLEAEHAAQVFITPKKMGAQTSEANTNAGTAAARQIVAFLEHGERIHVVN